MQFPKFTLLILNKSSIYRKVLLNWMAFVIKPFIIVYGFQLIKPSSICLILHIILVFWLSFTPQLQSILFPLVHFSGINDIFGKNILDLTFHIQLPYLQICSIFSNLPSEASLSILGFLLIKKSHIVPIRSKPLSTPSDIYKSCVTNVEVLSKRLTCFEVSCFLS